MKERRREKKKERQATTQIDATFPPAPGPFHNTNYELHTTAATQNMKDYHWLCFVSFLFLCEGFDECFIIVYIARS